MSFWESSVGAISGRPDDAFTRGFTSIPDNTKLRAKIKSFEIVDGQYDKYLEITWTALDTQFEGQLIRQKVKCWDNDPAKKHKALNMFMLLHNLYGFQAADREPMRGDLMRFINKAAGIKVQLTKPTEEGKRYNWVSEVHDVDGFESYVPEVIEESVTVTPNRNDSQDFDSDVPF